MLFVSCIAYCIAEISKYPRKLAGPHGGSIAKAEKAANKSGFTLMDTNLGEIFRVVGRVPGVHCNPCAVQRFLRGAIWIRFAPLLRKASISREKFNLLFKHFRGSDIN